VSLDRRDLAGLLAAVVLAAGCVRLGFWQLDRLRQRRERNAVTRAARARPPLEVTAALAADSARDRRLHARGVYDYAGERLWRPRMYEGAPGVALITPLKLVDGEGVLVDRGWAPSPDAYHVDQRAYRESDTADVLGIGMAAPRAPGDVDPVRLRDSLAYPLLPFVIQQLPSDRPTVRPSVGLIRWPPPALSDGPHLSYAIQWFIFATIGAIGWPVLLYRKSRDPEEAAEVDAEV